MRRIGTLLALLTWLGTAPVLVAADMAGAGRPPLDLPWWTILPFVLVLLAIAILPLVASHFWESNLRKGLVVAILSGPLAVYLLAWGEEGAHALLHSIEEYASFMILLAALYTVAGGIALRGDLRGTPWNNAAFLALGAALANVIGTTGASILLIRPVLRINKTRQRVTHIPVFFIFVVSNLGGLLTPLGDPPLFLGFLKGVDFFWTLRLWPEWLVANGLVIGVFLLWDGLLYARDAAAAYPAKGQREPLRLLGLINLVFLAGILVGVLAQSPAVAGEFALQKPWGEAIMVLMAVLSWFLTPWAAREANQFRWHAIIEVAVLFAGIFVAMVPALAILQLHGAELAQRLNVTQPWQFFWLTGTLSSFLDNAPTYVTLATVAAQSDHFGQLSVEKPLILAAISAGAVFMGANTYIGNGPNFMVKAIAEESGYSMPSFFGYMLYSGVILLPILVLLTFLFFR